MARSMLLPWSASALIAAAAAGEPERGWRDWWDSVDESEHWQSAIFYTLSGLYSLVAFVALMWFCWTLVGFMSVICGGIWFFNEFTNSDYNCPVKVVQVQLIRIQLRVPEFGWTTQKIFHLMNFIINGSRAVLFGLYKKVFLLESKALEIALLDIPGLLFFSTYTLLVLFWAEIYHQARSLPIDKLRPAYLIINGVVYVIQVSLWVYIRLSHNPMAVEVAKLFFSVVSFVAAVGFLTYGGRLFFMLRRFPIESKGRQKKLNEVGFVTGICATCFLVRCVVVALSAFDKDADLDVLDHPILNFIYYMLVEILPSSLVLFILRKLPPKRISDQYHPIN